MTVEQLIEKLKEMPPYREVLANGSSTINEVYEAQSTGTGHVYVYIGPHGRS